MNEQTFQSGRRCVAVVRSATNNRQSLTAQSEQIADWAKANGIQLAGEFEAKGRILDIFDEIVHGMTELANCQTLIFASRDRLTRGGPTGSVSILVQS